MMATIETLPAPQATRTIEPREYIIFTPIGDSSDSEEFVILGRAEGKTKGEALDKFVETLPADEQAGPFVPVAASAWKLMSPEVKTKTTRRWS